MIRFLLLVLLVLPIWSQTISGPGTINGSGIIGLGAATSGGGSWLPSDEASLVAWWKADVGVTNISNASPPADGDNVRGWKDNGTHGNSATNLDTNFAVYKTGLQNGLPGIRFDGTLSELRANGIPAYVNGNDTPMIWAMAFRNNKNFQAGIWFQSIKSGGTAEFIRAEIDGSNRYFCTRNDGSVEKNVYVDYTGGTVNWHVAVWLCTGTTASWYHDGTLLTPAAQDVDVGTIESGTDIFFIGRDNGGVHWGGDIGEVLIFNSASVDPANIYTYLKGRWATP